MWQLFHYLRNAVLYVFRIPTRFFGIPKRLLHLSFPMRVAVLLAIFLTLLTVTAFVGFILHRERSTPDWSEWLKDWQQMVFVVALLIAIPVVVYHALRLWLMPETSRYPDIDRAWNEGLSALKHHGLSLDQVPLFFILGAANEVEIQSLMAASGYPFVIAGVPDGRSPLHWYATEDAIFLFTRGLGCLSQFNRAAAPGASIDAMSADPSADPSAGPGGATDIRSTLVAGQGATPTSIADTGPRVRTGSSAMGVGDIRGTLVAGDVRQTMVPSGAGSEQTSSGGKTISLRDLEDASEELEYVCQLLQKSRQPLCGLNGIMMLLPASIIDGARYMAAAREMPATIRRDLTTIRDTTNLCCPVTALVIGMEEEPGFTELIRRIGFEKAKGSRFGKGFRVWNEPSKSNLDAVAMHACGSFEDWVYALFKSDGGLKNTGNGRLYALLCKIRSRWHARLRSILLNGFAMDDEEPIPLFGGCYFAATGATEDQQAFVRSALDKMIQQEEELEWTDEALREDSRFHQLATVGLFANALLVLILVGLGVYMFGGWGS